MSIGNQGCHEIEADRRKIKQQGALPGNSKELNLPINDQAARAISQNFVQRGR